MKSITTITLIFFTTLLFAQTNPATPNADFQSWTHYSAGYDDPDSWNCLNPTTTTFGLYTCVKDSTPADVYTGKYSARLITMSYFGQLIPGTMTTGTINTTSQTISGGLSYTLRPDSIIGWYKYTSASGDNADIEFYLFGSSNSDTVGEAFYKTPTSTVGAYTRFSLPLTYRSSHAVQTALWIVTSSVNQNNGKVGSQLYVGELGLVFDSATGINNIINQDMITVGPNPANGFISIRNISNSKSLLFSLFDVTGRKVEEERIINGTNNIQLNGISGGAYIYYMQDEQNNVIKTGKIIVQ